MIRENIFLSVVKHVVRYIYFNTYKKECHGSRNGKFSEHTNVSIKCNETNFFL